MRAGFPVERDPARHSNGEGGAFARSVPRPLSAPIAQWKNGPQATEQRLFEAPCPGSNPGGGLCNFIRLPASAVNELSQFSAFCPVLLRRRCP